MLSLDIKTRERVGKLDAMRASGVMPAVYYGPKNPSTSISVSTVEFKKVWKKAGESSVVELKEEDGAEHEVLIHAVDVHPLTSEPRHADFYVIEKGKKLAVSVQLLFTGISPAVKEKEGILVKVRRELDIEAMPRDLPHDLVVDISKLIELTDVIYAKDIAIPVGVELKTKAEEVVASITVAKEEVIEVPTPIDMSAIEVEAKGKEVKGGEEAPKEEDKKESPNVKAQISNAK